MDFSQLLTTAPTDAEKQQALISAIGKQRAAAQLGLLTGDRVLGGFGHAMLGDAQKQEETAQRDEAAGSAAGARALAMALAAQEKAKADKRAEEAAAAAAAEHKIDNTRADLGLGIQTQNAANTAAMLKLALERNARDATKDARVEAEKALGERLPAESAMKMGDVPAAFDQLNALKKAYRDLGMGTLSAKASSLLPNAVGEAIGTNAAEFNNAVSVAMQGVGTIFEGGKLAAGDEAKYRSMLPKARTDPKLAEEKIDQANAFLRNLVEHRIKALKGQGYRTAGLEAPPPASPSATPGVPAAAVKMRFPDGSVHDVPAEKTALAARKGGVEVK